MKINDPSSAGIGSTKLGESQAAGSVGRGGRSNAAAAGAGAGDQVQLSDLASTVRALSSDSPERTARLERLAMEVQSGRYEVNAQALSASIVDGALKGF